MLLLFQVSLTHIAKHLRRLPLLEELFIDVRDLVRDELDNFDESYPLVTVKHLAVKDNNSLRADTFIELFPLMFPRLVSLRVESLSGVFLGAVANSSAAFNHATIQSVRTPEQTRANRTRILYPYAGPFAVSFQAAMYEALPQIEGYAPE